MVFIPVFTSLLFVPLIQMYCNLHLFNLNFNLQALIFAYGIEGDGRALKSYLFAVDQIDHSACSMSLFYLLKILRIFTSASRACKQLL